MITRITNRSLHLRPTYRYEQLSSELYFLNQRETYSAKFPSSIALKPLKGANQGFIGPKTESSDECYVTGVPYGMPKDKFENYDLFASLNVRNRPDLIFLQIDPSPYIARQRFLAHKCALQSVDGYDIHDCPTIDPLKPHQWEEAIVNLVVLDMLNQNQNFDKIDWTKGFATYCYPHIQGKEIRESNTKKFIESIDEHIVNHKYSDFHLINRILYTALMGKHKVLLGDMPQHLHKLNIGNTLEIGEARDIFKYSLQKVKELQVPISLKKAAYDFLPHVFQTPKDLYITGLLKSVFQAAEVVNAYVGIPHLQPIKHYWVDPPLGINYSEGSRIPPRRPGETDENLIEKHALLDVLLETHTWAEPYLSNPFPYIVGDLTQASAGDLKAMKECFFMYYQKYSGYKNELQKELPHFKDDYEIKFLGQSATDIKYENSIEIKAMQERQIARRNVQLIQ